MFAKLLKAEFRAVRSGMAAVCASALIAGVAGGLALRYMNGTDWGIYYDSNALELICCLVEAGALIALVACGVAAVILLLGRYYKSRFTDEGYLTFTLPVNTHEILLSSLVSSLLCLILVAVVITGSFALLCLIGVSGDPDFWEWFLELPQALSESLQRLIGSDPQRFTRVLLQSIAFVLAAYLWEILCLMLSVTVGALAAKKHKILAAVGVFYLIHTAVGIAQVFQLSSYSDAIFTNMLALYLLLSVAAYFLSYHLVDKKLNLA